jgi:hypothetical protein
VRSESIALAVNDLTVPGAQSIARATSSTGMSAKNRKTKAAR